MNLVSVMNLTKTHGEKTLFHDLTFGIDAGQRIGLIGINGTGKSTLLRVLAGVDQADSGQVVHGSSLRIEFLPQNPEFDESLTVLQSVFQGGGPELRLLYDYEQLLGELEQRPDDAKLQARLVHLQQQMDTHNAWELEANAKIILHRLGIVDFHAIVGQLSGGQRKRVAMARALIRPADLLILDEPTNHIDNETVDWLESYLAKSKSALLLITHDRYFLDRVTNRIFELDKGMLYTYEGGYETFLLGKAQREESALASEDKRQNLLRRELAWLHRGAKARTTKQKARVEFAEALRDQKVDKPSAKLEIGLASQRLGKKVIELTNVEKRFGNKTLIHDFSYLIGPGERLGIVGPNGSGKSTLLNLMAGRVEPDSGTVTTGETVKLAYYTQENLELDEHQRVIEYIRETAHHIRTADGETLSAGQMLERFLFPPATQWTPIGKLSGGEKRRLYLLRTLMTEPNVLLLDEPTNDLDIQTLTVLEDYLDQFAGTVITVSHDRYFLDRSVDKLLCFEDGVIRTYQGMYSEYQASRAERTPVHVEKKADVPAAPPAEPAKKRKFSFHEQREFDTIEDRIATLEDQLTQVGAELAKGGSDYTHLQKLMNEQSRLEDDLNAAIERWAELNAMAEEFAKQKK